MLLARESGGNFLLPGRIPALDVDLRDIRVRNTDGEDKKRELLLEKGDALATRAIRRAEIIRRLRKQSR